jgi:small subunit ribosomal protein S20
VPNIKSAEKWTRQTQKRSRQNLDVRTRLRTLFKKVLGSQDAQAQRDVEGAYDRAARKHVIHPNKAARKKSRLARAMKTTAVAKAPKRKSAAKRTGAKKAAAKRTARKTTKKR